MKKWILFLIILFAFSELNAQSVGDVMTWKGQYLRPGYLPPNWNYLTNKPSTFTATAHGYISAYHTASGLTPGHFLKALTSTTFGFAAHGLSYTDVGAAASGHNHTGVYQPVITLLSTALGGTNFNGYDQGDTNNFMMYDQNGDRLIPSGYTRYSFSLSGHTHATSSTKITTDTLFFSGDGLIDGNGDITTPFRGIFWGDPYRVWTEIADVADTAKKILVSGSPPTYRKINGDFIDDTAKVGYAGTNGYLLQADSSNNIKNSPFTITGIPESLAAVRAYAVDVADIGVDPGGDPDLYYNKTGGWTYPAGGGGSGGFDIINVDSFAVNAWYDTIVNSSITNMDRWDAHVYQRTLAHASPTDNQLEAYSKTDTVIFACSDTSYNKKYYWYGRSGTIVDTVAGGSTGFDPTSVNGDGVTLRVWYSGRKESTPGSMTTITDWTNGAYNLTSIGTKTCTLKTGGANNKSYFHFRGAADQALYRAAVTSSWLVGYQKQFTMIVVSQAESSLAVSRTAVLVGLDGSGTPNYGYLSYDWATAPSPTAMKAFFDCALWDTSGTDAGRWDNARYHLGADTTAWQTNPTILAGAYYSPHTTATSDSLYLYFNALLPNRLVNYNPVVTLGDSINYGNYVVLGGWKHGTETATDYFPGKIYEVYIYEGFLNDTKRKIVMDGLDELFLTGYTP